MSEDVELMLLADKKALEAELARVRQHFQGLRQSLREAREVAARNAADSQHLRRTAIALEDRLRAGKMSCTCDAVGTGPCPSHHRENSLQDEVLGLREKLLSVREDVLADFRQFLFLETPDCDCPGCNGHYSVRMIQAVIDGMRDAIRDERDSSLCPAVNVTVRPATKPTGKTGNRRKKPPQKGGLSKPGRRPGTKGKPRPGT